MIKTDCAVHTILPTPARPSQARAANGLRGTIDREILVSVCVCVRQKVFWGGAVFLGRTFNVI